MTCHRFSPKPNTPGFVFSRSATVRQIGSSRAWVRFFEVRGGAPDRRLPPSRSSQRPLGSPALLKEILLAGAPLLLVHIELYAPWRCNALTAGGIC